MNNYNCSSFEYTTQMVKVSIKFQHLSYAQTVDKGSLTKFGALTSWVIKLTKIC